MTERSSDRHRIDPISFRPSADDAAWLKAYASSYGLADRAILKQALAAFRLNADGRRISPTALAAAHEGLADYDDWTHDRGAYTDQTRRLDPQTIAHLAVAAAALLAAAGELSAPRTDAELARDAERDQLAAAVEAATADRTEVFGPVDMTFTVGQAKL